MYRNDEAIAEVALTDASEALCAGWQYSSPEEDSAACSLRPPRKEAYMRNKKQDQTTKSDLSVCQASPRFDSVGGDSSVIKGPPLSPLRSIRFACLDCAGGSPKEVRYCTCLTCALWLYRFGRRPSSVIRSEGSKSAKLFDKKKFEDGGSLGPEKSLSELN